MPHGITQCYLPPDRGDIPALTPAEAGTLDSATPEGCKAELTYNDVVAGCVIGSERAGVLGGCGVRCVVAATGVCLSVCLQGGT